MVYAVFKLSEETQVPSGENKGKLLISTNVVVNLKGQSLNDGRQLHLPKINPAEEGCAFGCNANPVALLVPPAAPKGFREENFAPTDSDTNTIPREEKTRDRSEEWVLVIRSPTKLDACVLFENHRSVHSCFKIPW